MSRNCPIQFCQIFLEGEDQNWTTTGVQEDFEGKSWIRRGQILDLGDKTRTKMGKGQELDSGWSEIGHIWNK